MYHRLTEDDRDLLRGHYLQGTSVDETAKAVGCSQPTVRTAFHQFELVGLTRGNSPRKGPAQIDRRWPEPYEGPEWIGKSLPGARGVDRDGMWIIEMGA